MADESPIKEKLNTNLIWSVSILVDNVFLAIWVLAQWGVGRLVEKFPAHGIDYYAILVAQCFFALSTLAPIVLWTWQDISKMYYRTKLEISKAKQASLPGEGQAIPVNEVTQKKEKEADESPIKEKLNTNLIWSVSILVDNVFLAIWVLAQWGVGRLVEKFPAHGIDYYAILVAQMFFALSTLAPIVLSIWLDIAKMYYRTKSKISKAKQASLLGEGQAIPVNEVTQKQEKEKEKVK
jgi:uncharacterized membrane protein YciS (DUF1049 family)